MMAVELPERFARVDEDEDLSYDIGGDTPPLPASTPLRILPQQDFSGYSPEQLSALRFQQGRQLGTVTAPPSVRQDPGLLFEGLPATKLKASPETVASALDVLAAMAPEEPGIPPMLSPEERQEIMGGKTRVGLPSQVLSGLQEATLQGVEAATSPAMVMTAGLGGVSPLLGRLATAGWTAEMIRSAGPAGQELALAYESGDPQRITKATANMAALGFFAVGAGRQAFTPRLTPESFGGAFRTPASGQFPQVPGVGLPESLRALGEIQPVEGGELRAKEEGQKAKDVLTTTGEGQTLPTTPSPNAIQQKAGAVLRNVPEQPGGGAGVVPGQEVPGQGAPGTVPPGDTGGAPPAEEARPGEVPLAQERFRQAEEAPAKPEIVRKSSSTYKNNHGDPLGTTYRASPEDWAAWQKVQEDVKQARAQGKGLEELQDILKENERIKNKYGGMPPEPPAEPAQVSEASPLEHEKFTTTDDEGNNVADVTKLREAIQKGEIKGGEAANGLLDYLLKPDEKHPLRAIKILDLTPEQLKAVSGGKVAYRGRFSLARGTREGAIEILTRDQNGQPISHAEFVKTLNHELTHNAVTSKFDSAPPEVKSALKELFDHAKEQAKGTEFEGHNAMADVHEFLSEAASSPKIQTWLTKMAYEGAGKAKNVWGRFVELVHKILRAPANLPLTALDEAMRISGELEGIRREATPAGEQRMAPAEDPDRWTGATDPNRRGEAGFISMAPLQALVQRAAPAVRSAVDAVKNIAAAAKERVVETGKEAVGTPKMTDYRRSVLNWSAKLQRSFGEAAAAQKEIEQRVPDPVRREGITNWLQAGGDANVLQQRAAATADPKLRAGYQAALNLNPTELALANQIQSTYGVLGQRGQAADVLNSFKDNYVTQIWDVGRGVRTPSTGGSSRTLKERFKFAKASSFPTFFDGEQAGYKPKTKDISKLLPIYMHEMNSVIAARELVSDMSEGTASDGRPLIVPRGTGVPVESQQFAVTDANGRTVRLYDTQAQAQANLRAGQTIVPRTNKATLVMPKAVKGDTLDYKVLPNQPALQDWRWATQDDAGNPVLLKSDLALHPDAYNRIKSVLGRSAIREWYSTPTTRLAAIPKIVVKGFDNFNAGTKRTMLGLLAPFHQVQTGTHALGHRVNPFGNIPKIDLVNDAGQMDAARHGLMLLPDRASEQQFMEGFRTSGLISRIPGIGKVSDFYSDYLFKQYIPGLKYKTFQAILTRNQKVYASDLAAGRVNPEDIKILSAEQANAAYGHLNYADLHRNPTLQHIWQLGLLAPDFLEARGRFAAQAIKGSVGAKAGREQMLALATLAVGQAAAAFTAAKLSGGEWDKKRPFEFTVGSRRYSIRSVPEDMQNLLTNTRTFVHSRLSPIIGKGVLQYATGVDYAGRKVSAGETTKELLTQPLPITTRSLPGIRNYSGAERPGAIKWWEQLAGAVGLKISRFNPKSHLADLHAKWLASNPDPKVKADYERNQAAVFPVSKYRSLDAALEDRDADAAAKAIAELRPLVKKDSDIVKRMRPYIGTGLHSSHKPLFHESSALEKRFVRSMAPEDRIAYERALKERQEEWRLFLDVWGQRGPKKGAAPETGQP